MIIEEKTEDPPPDYSEFDVLSWNILADNYVSQQYFPYVEKQYLQYDYRISLVKQFIKNKSPSIICLQEVDLSKSFFDYLAQEGYEHRYKAKGMQGILIAFKRNIFKLVEQHSACFDDLLTGKQDKFIYSKGHTILMLKLRGLGKQLVIANTHLFWDPKYERVKYHQICSCIQLIKKFAFETNSIIFCGDLNSLPNSNVVRLLDSNQAPRMQSCIDANNNYYQMMQKYAEVQNSRLELNSVFDENDGLYTNITPNFQGRIDYIFYSRNSVQLLGKQKLVSPEPGSYIPNREFPSDHIPLLCRFT